MTSHLSPPATHLKIGWLYPEQMSTYGDRGNITVLQKRCEWRDIKINIVNINQNSNVNIFNDIDLLFAGGAQDREQKIIINDLRKKKTAIQSLIDRNIPALFVCGAPQLFGKYYEPSVGNRIEGLGIFDIISKHPGQKKKRLIGNIVAEINNESFITSHFPASQNPSGAGSQVLSIIGFENHGGRTYLGSTALPLAKVLNGFGNNGEDYTEGVIYNNAIGTYFHGPFLSKNPEIADWLIKTALETKYNKSIYLERLDDTLEIKGREAIAKRMGVKL